MNEKLNEKFQKIRDKNKVLPFNYNLMSPVKSMNVSLVESDFHRSSQYLVKFFYKSISKVEC